MSLDPVEREILRRELERLVRQIVVDELGYDTPLPSGYHGRWNELTPSDFKFLRSCGISIIWEDEKHEDNVSFA